MIWSILICSLIKREEQLYSLLKNLYSQIIESNLLTKIEVLVEIDNKEISTGAKRNKLLNRASGKYVSFIDDDDEVSLDYVKEIYDALKASPDCVGFSGYMTWDGTKRTRWRLSSKYTDRDVHDKEGLFYERRVNHLSPVKREIALVKGFPDKSNAEDKAYSEGIINNISTEIYIEKELYHYKYKTHDKEY